MPKPTISHGMEKHKKRRLVKLAVFSIFLTFVASIPFVDAQINKNRINPGIKIANLEIGNKTKEEAQKILNDAFAPIENGVAIILNNQNKNISGFLKMDKQTTVEKAYALGRETNLVKNFLNRLKLRLYGKVLKPDWSLDEQKFTHAITSGFTETLKQPVNARFTIAFDKDQNPQISLIPEEAGLSFDRIKALNDLKNRLNQISTEPITLESILIEPDIKEENLVNLRPVLEKILSGPQPQLKFKDSSWIIEDGDLAQWLEVKKIDQTLSFNLNEEKLKIFLEKIAEEIDRLPQNAIFELDESGTRVKKFIPAQNGYQLYVNENLQKLNHELITQLLEEKTDIIFELSAGETKPKISTGESNQLGIKEIVGVGKTNFRGSPPNRVKNIKRGAEILNGILIKPDEEFSLLSKLRPFTEKNGYYKELVIKPAEGRTVPEIGGGLCQIGTNAFRVALNAGLPITQRANHFYRVSYYEPPVGMDATIYDPSPDFKFVNDTGNYLLLITHVKGNDLIFELWGMPDGRKIEISKPVVYNIVKPPKKRVIETLELKPGERKCTEKPYVGSDAKFTSKVTYPDGSVKEKEFFSRYKPWQEVCLLGVEKLSEKPQELTEVQQEDSETLGTPVIRD